MTKTNSSILRPGHKDNLPTAGLIFRVQNQVMNARPETIYSALAFLYDLRGDRLATSDEYQTLLNDASHARELLYHLAGEAGSVELLYGFFSGRNVETISPSELESDEQWEERQAAIQRRERMTVEVDLIDQPEPEPPLAVLDSAALEALGYTPEVIDAMMPADEREPDIDDSVRFCPECETPNQFGEVCDRCRREIQLGGWAGLEVD